MNCLFDTHALLWYLDGDSRLGLGAQRAIAAQGNTIFLSTVSYWEICIKLSLGKLRLSPQWPEAIDVAMRDGGMRWLHLSPLHARTIVNLPFHHRDPFDRMLVAQAMCEELAILSADPMMGLYDVTVIWTKTLAHDEG